MVESIDPSSVPSSASTRHVLLVLDSYVFFSHIYVHVFVHVYVCCRPMHACIALHAYVYKQCVSYQFVLPRNETDPRDINQAGRQTCLRAQCLCVCLSTTFT
jgi:hypothetical protein